MERKAVILSAGMGRRMGETGKQLPKCLLPVLGKPILFHHVDRLLSTGLRDITVVTGHRSEKVLSAVKEVSRYSFVRCLFNPFYQYTDSIVSLWLYLVEQRKEGGLVVLSGDRIIHPEIYQAVQGANEITLIVLGPKEYSVVPKDSVIIREDRVMSIGERSPYVSGGILYVSDRKITGLVELSQKILLTKGGTKRWYLEAVKEALKDGERIKCFAFPPNFCVNVNRPADLCEAQIPLILRGEIPDDK